MANRFSIYFGMGCTQKNKNALMQASLSRKNTMDSLLKNKNYLALFEPGELEQMLGKFRPIKGRESDVKFAKKCQEFNRWIHNCLHHHFVENQQKRLKLLTTLNLGINRPVQNTNQMTALDMTDAILRNEDIRRALISDALKSSVCAKALLENDALLLSKGERKPEPFLVSLLNQATTDQIKIVLSDEASFEQMLTIINDPSNRDLLKQLFEKPEWLKALTALQLVKVIKDYDKAFSALNKHIDLENDSAKINIAMAINHLCSSNINTTTSTIRQATAKLANQDIEALRFILKYPADFFWDEALLQPEDLVDLCAKYEAVDHGLIQDLINHYFKVLAGNVFYKDLNPLAILAENPELAKVLLSSQVIRDYLITNHANEITPDFVLQNAEVAKAFLSSESIRDHISQQITETFFAKLASFYDYDNPNQPGFTTKELTTLFGYFDEKFEACSTDLIALIAIEENENKCLKYAAAVDYLLAKEKGTKLLFDQANQLKDNKLIAPALLNHLIDTNKHYLRSLTSNLIVDIANSLVLNPIVLTLDKFLDALKSIGIKLTSLIQSSDIFGLINAKKVCNNDLLAKEITDDELLDTAVGHKDNNDFTDFINNEFSTALTQRGTDLNKLVSDEAYHTVRSQKVLANKLDPQPALWNLLSAENQLLILLENKKPLPSNVTWVECAKESEAHANLLFTNYYEELPARSILQILTHYSTNATCYETLKQKMTDSVIQIAINNDDAKQYLLSSDANPLVEKEGFPQELMDTLRAPKATKTQSPKPASLPKMSIPIPLPTSAKLVTPPAKTVAASTIVHQTSKRIVPITNLTDFRQLSASEQVQQLTQYGEENELFKDFLRLNVVAIRGSLSDKLRDDKEAAKQLFTSGSSLLKGNVEDTDKPLLTRQDRLRIALTHGAEFIYATDKLKTQMGLAAIIYPTREANDDGRNLVRNSIKNLEKDFHQLLAKNFHEESLIKLAIDNVYDEPLIKSLYKTMETAGNSMASILSKRPILGADKYEKLTKQLFDVQNNQLLLSELGPQIFQVFEAQKLDLTKYGSKLLLAVKENPLIAQELLKFNTPLLKTVSKHIFDKPSSTTDAIIASLGKDAIVLALKVTQSLGKKGNEFIQNNDLQDRLFKATIGNPAAAISLTTIAKKDEEKIPLSLQKKLFENTPEAMQVRETMGHMNFLMFVIQLSKSKRGIDLIQANWPLILTIAGGSPAIAKAFLNEKFLKEKLQDKQDKQNIESRFAILEQAQSTDAGLKTFKNTLGAIANANQKRAAAESQIAAENIIAQKLKPLMNEQSVDEIKSLVVSPEFQNESMQAALTELLSESNLTAPVAYALSFYSSFIAQEMLKNYSSFFTAKQMTDILIRHVTHDKSTVLALVENQRCKKIDGSNLSSSYWSLLEIAKDKQAQKELFEHPVLGRLLLKKIEAKTEAEQLQAQVSSAEPAPITVINAVAFSPAPINRNASQQAAFDTVSSDNNVTAAPESEASTELAPPPPPPMMPPPPIFKAPKPLTGLAKKSDRKQDEAGLTEGNKKQEKGADTGALLGSIRDREQKIRVEIRQSFSAEDISGLDNDAIERKIDEVRFRQKEELLKDVGKKSATTSDVTFSAGLKTTSRAVNMNRDPIVPKQQASVITGIRDGIITTYIFTLYNRIKPAGSTNCSKEKSAKILSALKVPLEALFQQRSVEKSTIQTILTEVMSKHIQEVNKSPEEELESIRKAVSSSPAEEQKVLTKAVDDIALIVHHKQESNKQSKKTPVKKNVPSATTLAIVQNSSAAATEAPPLPKRPLSAAIPTESNVVHNEPPPAPELPVTLNLRAEPTELAAAPTDLFDAIKKGITLKNATERARPESSGNHGMFVAKTPIPGLPDSMLNFFVDEFITLLMKLPDQLMLEITAKQSELGQEELDKLIDGTSETIEQKKSEVKQSMVKLFEPIYTSEEIISLKKAIADIQANQPVSSQYKAIKDAYQKPDRVRFTEMNQAIQKAIEPIVKAKFDILINLYLAKNDRVSPEIYRIKSKKYENVPGYIGSSLVDYYAAAFASKIKEEMLNPKTQAKEQKTSQGDLATSIAAQMAKRHAAMGNQEENDDEWDDEDNNNYTPGKKK